MPIRDRGEMLSLTDMWKASHSPEHREPYNWARKEGATFVDAVALAQNLPVEQVLVKRQGRNGGTMAHWQIGLAYAKYLAPNFRTVVNQQRLITDAPVRSAALVDGTSASPVIRAPRSSIIQSNL